MRERIDIQTWNLICDTTVTTWTQTNPPPPPHSKKPYTSSPAWLISPVGSWNEKSVYKYELLVFYYDENELLVLDYNENEQLVLDYNENEQLVFDIVKYE